MPAPAFHFQEMFELGADETEYRLLTRDHVSVENFQGQEMLVVQPEALTLVANQAFHDINFFLRPKHLKQVAAILDDPEASENDRMVALTMLKNADVASAGLLPFCQDTGTAMRPRCRRASISPIPRIICAIHRMRR
jgi:fumarate hydratase class I